MLIVETNVAATQRALFYGLFSNGSICIGNSTDAGGNRDLIALQTAGATNITKLLNGTKAAAVNPAGGGYFYVTAGVLNWADQSGIVSQLSQSVAGQIAGSATVAYTNNAAANAGTLTNAPAIGNPTKWIPINDNGTIRNIPAW